jgi:hypothetical protein
VTTIHITAIGAAKSNVMSISYPPNTLYMKVFIMVGQPAKIKFRHLPI